MSSNNDEQQQQAPPSPNRPRRASFAELFASRPSIDTGTTSGQRSSAMSVALNQQAQDQARTRRLSITTLGLSGSPTHTQQTSPFGTIKRGKSMSTSDRSGSAIEEDSAVDDDKDCVPPMSPARGTPPGARRVSFGARAYGSVRAGSISAGISGLPSAGGMNANGEAGGDAGSGVTSTAARASPPGMKRSGEGFSWAENMRSRAERASISAASGSGAMMGMAGHSRSKSQAMAEPQTVKPAPPVKTPPKAPDHFQERILKGDFYMD